MCGIIGRVGTDNAVSYLIKGLERLEYRGYDSAGIAILNQNKIETQKALGRLSNLKKSIESNPETGCIGIGHTRWATHGKPSHRNAHPHLSPDGKFAVVHNGIIENADRIKKEYFPDTVFSSETDTEVIAHLLQRYYDGDIIKTISVVEKMLCGSYALGILFEYEPETLYCTAKSSPLIAATGNNGSFIASDVSALNGWVDEYYKISDGEICALTNDSIKIFDVDAKCKSKNPKKLLADSFYDDMLGYEHYMMLEIMQQPKAVEDTLKPLIKNGDICIDTGYLSGITEAVIVACGSAYHTGLVGKYLFNELCKIKCTAEIASEFRYANPIIGSNTLAIFISQSGETADTLAALRLAKQSGAKTLSIVNVRSSAIAAESDFVIYTNAGREVAVATTKAYSAQLAVLYALTLKISKETASITTGEYEAYLKELMLLPQKISQAIMMTKQTAFNIAKKFYKKDDIYFIGRLLDYAVCAEGSLKCKEISYIHSEVYPAGELKHGTISLIDNGTPVIAVATDNYIFKKTVSNIREVEARGASTVIITFDKNADEFKNSDVLLIPETLPLFSVSLSVIPLQFFAYYIAYSKGCDIDKPKNLAKSVTVE